VSAARPAVRFLLPFLAIAAHAEEPQGDAAIIRRGLPELPALLARIDDSDAHTRMRARHLATRIVLDHYTRIAPAGMRLVYGPTRITSRGVHLDGGFYLSAREITRAEFVAFAKATKRSRDRWADGEPDFPVTWVTQIDAAAYAEWKGARLPTLEELSNAATSFGRFPYPWGRRFDARCLNSREGGRGGEVPPGSCKRGRSPAGIDDLLGNVSEWTTTVTGSARRMRVFGGSYRDRADGRRAPFAVTRMAATARSAQVGFRLALSLPRLPTEPPRAPASDSDSGKSRR